MYITLTPGQELIVVALRKTLLSPTDDLLAVTREFINPAVSRTDLGRRLRRHGVSGLRYLAGQESGVPATQKTFKDYEPGFGHIDIKYRRRCRTRPLDFLAKVRNFCTVNITKLLTDNGSEFTDRYTAEGKNMEPGEQHVFESPILASRGIGIVFH